MKEGNTKKRPVECHDWSEAFDCCRERDRPMWVRVGGEVAKCYPSGACKSEEDVEAEEHLHEMDGC